MDDTQRLDLIEHYGWKIQRTLEFMWAVDGDFGSVRERTVRRAIKAAMKAQAEWATFDNQQSRKTEGTRHRPQDGE